MGLLVMTKTGVPLIANMFPFYILRNIHKEDLTTDLHNVRIKKQRSKIHVLIVIARWRIMFTNIKKIWRNILPGCRISWPFLFLLSFPVTFCK